MDLILYNLVILAYPNLLGTKGYVVVVVVVMLHFSNAPKKIEILST
jgi:hypothetical protein